MKSIILIAVLIFIGTIAFSQQRVKISKELQDYGVRIDDSYNHSDEWLLSKPPLKSISHIEEDIGMTYYDLQTNASTQKRIHVFDDGTMGTVWTLGYDFPTFMDDRGTGYNYFDGQGWGPFPTEPLEEYRSGWPCYAPFGENGEIIVSHISGSSPEEGLTLLMRENKGVGEWEEWNFIGPQGCENIIWPRLATGGINHSVIHLIAVSAPTANCGVPPYQGQEIAILYSRSYDGGNSWDPENYIIPQIDSSHYYGFNPDVYDIRADGDNVGVLIGFPWVDLLLLKSSNGGDTWEKTIIWEHPYPMWNPNSTYPTDTFYCADGAHSLDFDNDGIAHVVFGVNKTVYNGAFYFWFPAVGGIGYWNENRPTFSNNLNALNPYGHPDSELEEDYSLIGWTQDINGNGELDILDDWGTYYLGFSSMPQIIYDDFGDILVFVFSSVTETADNGTQNYRHLWMRGSPDNGNNWGQHHLLTSDLSQMDNECVFPSLAPYCNEWETYYLTYQCDSEPGLAVRGDEDPYAENYIKFMKTEFDVGINENINFIENLRVSQNVPNPFKEKSKILVELFDACNLSVEVVNLTGQKVLEIDRGYVNQGTHNISISAEGLNPGLYFYTVKAGDAAVTRKMVVE